MSAGPVGCGAVDNIWQLGQIGLLTEFFGLLPRSGDTFDEIPGFGGRGMRERKFPPRLLF